MTPAEFDTKRRMLGLSIDEVAALPPRPVSNRAVNDWMRGITPLPQDKIVALNLLNIRIDNAIEKAVQFAKIQAANVVELKRYRTKEAHEKSQYASQMPFGAHAILIGLTAEALEAEGIRTEIVWCDALET